MTDSRIVKLADLNHLANRPLPSAPDGRYDSQLIAANEPQDDAADHAFLYNLVSKIEYRLKHPLIRNPKDDVEGLAQLLLNKDAVDDRTKIFNNLLDKLCRMDHTMPLAKKVNSEVITILYNTLVHPPATYVGTDVPQSLLPPPTARTAPADAVTAPRSNTIRTDVPRMPFAFRSADGSGNNPLMPNLGRSGMPYARSVENKHPIPGHMLPDSGLVFDMLLKARDFKPHPGGNSALTFAWASLVTHSLFRTDPRDQTKNNTTSYLDLSILYGVNQDQQDLVRNKSLGRGLLYPDAFAEDRLVLVPPAATALLVIFSRNHNYIANMILKINERKRWTDPPPSDETKRALQDEEIFQVARLINCGHFMAMIFGDYVAGFIGTGRDGNSWCLEPFDPIEKDDGSYLGRGEGNHVSVEFNLLYRWHAVTAEQDIRWTENLFGRVFGTQKPFSELGMRDFIPAVSRAWADPTLIDPNPRTRTFGGLQRGSDGLFSDDDIARVLQDATDTPAGAYRARGTPEVLRVVEIMSMEQARAWGCCSMNEFRKFLKLKPFETFEEWNSDPEIAVAARQLYGHIDNLELYPGVQAEDTIPLGPGSGICCGYTMTRAILGDAIALVRGDRFYTTEYTAANLTSWGIQDCARDANNGAFGAALPKLLLRHLPRHYTANSSFALFPFFTPEQAEKNLSALGVKSKYDYDRPKPQPIPKVVDTLTGIRHVFGDEKKYKTTYGPDMRMLTQNYGFFLVFDEKQKHDTDRSQLLEALFPDKAKSVATYAAWYKQKTIELIKENSYELSGIPGTRVDIVRNVVNLVSVHWAADYLIGIPLKTKSNPKGIFTEQEVYDMLALLFTCVFINVQPEHGWKLRTTAKPVGDIVNELIEDSLNEAAPKTSANLIAVLLSNVTKLFKTSEEKLCYPFLRNLAKSGRPTKELAAQVIGLAVGSSVNYAQAAAQVVDFYLDDARTAERSEIISLVTLDDPPSNELLRGYVREAQRLNPQFAGLLRVAAEPDTIPMGDGKPPVTVQSGDIVFASYRNAQLNPADFPNPTEVNPRRPRDIYQNQGAGFHLCPGIDLSLESISEILKVVFSLKNLRRAPGQAGSMASFMLNQYGTDNKMYLDDTGDVTPWPGSLTVVYDK